MNPNDYLVEMTFTPFSNLLSPAEAQHFAERFALPTCSALERLAASGRILAGGSVLGAAGFAFIARVGGPEELEQMMASLPLSARAETRVVPLGSFGSRAATVRARVERLRDAAVAAPH